MMSYKKFAIMMIISFIVMYIVMFLNMDTIDHFHNSLTRMYMALLMVAPMAVSMILMMGKMYPSKKVNISILIMGVLVFGLSLAGLRRQIGIGDIQYMKAMIPHHSSAIMVSKRATITDPEVKELSKQIIESQEKEIKEMEAMLKRLE